MKELTINNKKVKIYYNKNTEKLLPVIILNTFNDESENVWNECQKIGCKDFILVAIEVNNWNDDLTPWICPPLYKGDEECLGYADKYLNELENIILKEIEVYLEKVSLKIAYYVIVGYSLAGLFSLYAAYKTDIFKRVAGVSSSFWYPNFLKFVEENKISDNIDKIYLSLGNKEAQTKNKILKTVEENTRKIYTILNKNINCTYEINEGNHFKDSTKRTAKGIKNIIED